MKIGNISGALHRYVYPYMRRSSNEKELPKANYTNITQGRRLLTVGSFITPYETPNLYTPSK